MASEKPDIRIRASTHWCTLLQGDNQIALGNPYFYYQLTNLKTWKQKNLYTEKYPLEQFNIHIDKFCPVVLLKFFKITRY
jgi:hypothetical protein